MNREPRVLHVNDCASTTAQLLSQARRRGLPWDYLPLARRDGPGGYLVGGATWAARLGAGALRHDLLHVHYASVHRHTRWTRVPHVLHAHGTDVRSQQYDPRWTGPVRAALRESAHVYYSTPDLAEHVLDHRPDAELFPVPVEVDALPVHGTDRGARTGPPVVLFASRWEAVKGLEEQLAAARGVLGLAGPGGVDVVGLDWGPAASTAAELGVRLLPRTDRAGFLHRLAAADVVVGQGSGMLAASELEAVGTGVPVVAALRPDWYPPADPPPVLVGPAGWAPDPAARVDAVVEGVRLVLAADPAPTGGRDWLRATHDAAAGVERLARRYRTLR